MLSRPTLYLVLLAFVICFTLMVNETSRFGATSPAPLPQGESCNSTCQLPEPDIIVMPPAEPVPPVPQILPNQPAAHAAQPAVRAVREPFPDPSTVQVAP
jgi:hypothetical protein